MNALVAQLLIDAKGIADEIAARPQRLAAETQRIKERMAEIEAINNAARDVPDRHARLKDILKSSRDLVCPSCFLEGRPMAFMLPVASYDGHLDLFRCQSCDHEAAVEV